MEPTVLLQITPNMHTGTTRISFDRLKQILRDLVPRNIRNWFRSPERSAKWVWDCTLFSLGFTRTLEIDPDWRIICHPHAYQVASRAQIGDIEQADEFRNFRSHCWRGMLLFDIGAHYGIFSLAAVHAGGKAVAVEPSPVAAHMISVQAAINGCAENIQVVRAAVSSEVGIMGLLSSGVFSDGYFRVASNRPKSELIQTPALTIDELTQRFGPPTHIKIDVEGHETSVLRGGGVTLARHSPLLFLEVHNEMVTSEGGDPDGVLDELARIGYNTFGLRGEAIKKSAILKYPIVRIVARRG
jgi:FkbM family methyltransferase